MSAQQLLIPVTLAILNIPRVHAFAEVVFQQLGRFVGGCRKGEGPW